MKVMVMVKATAASEAGALPSEATTLLPSVRGDLLEKLGRFDEARTEFSHAAALTRNARDRKLLLGRAAACGGGTQ